MSEFDGVTGGGSLPYYAVIFTSQLAEPHEGYEQMSERMVQLAREQPGFLGLDSTREGASGITVSYWESEEVIASWRANMEHLARMFHEHAPQTSQTGPFGSLSSPDSTFRILPSSMGKPRSVQRIAGPLRGSAKGIRKDRLWGQNPQSPARKRVAVSGVRLHETSGLAAQEKGRSTWYKSYRLQVAKVERCYGGDSK